MSLSPGTRLGIYEILAPIGAGGMGEVFQARDTRLDREVAIKVLPAAFAGDAERLARFEREAKTPASLNHPISPQIYGLEESEGSRALVMELIRGERIPRRVEAPAAIGYACQIAAGLEAAHSIRVVHRDLKPANILLTLAGGIKTLDFGLAAVVKPTHEAKARYIAPEMIASVYSALGEKDRVRSAIGGVTWCPKPVQVSGGSAPSCRKTPTRMDHLRPSWPAEGNGRRVHGQVARRKRIRATQSMPKPALKQARTEVQSDSESRPIRRTSRCKSVTGNNLKNDG